LTGSREPVCRSSACQARSRQRRHLWRSPAAYTEEKGSPPWTFGSRNQHADHAPPTLIGTAPAAAGPASRRNGTTFAILILTTLRMWEFESPRGHSGTEGKNAMVLRPPFIPSWKHRADAPPRISRTESAPVGRSPSTAVPSDHWPKIAGFAPGPSIHAAPWVSVPPQPRSAPRVRPRTAPAAAAA